MASSEGALRSRFGVTIRVLIHIVTWNSAPFVGKCLESILQLQLRCPDEFVVDIALSDNGSSDGSANLEGVQDRRIDVNRYGKNTGFCLPHNVAAKKVVEQAYDYLLVLNPDVALTPSCLERMITAHRSAEGLIGIVTPKLLRANDDLTPVVPRIIDAAGMIFTPALRHFDRGSDELDNGQFETCEIVSGATGACMLVSRECIDAIALPPYGTAALKQVFPEYDDTPRIQLFDEGFFAYREDAELSLRAHRLGWSTLYVPSAEAFHVRRVMPDRRARLSKEINRAGVRNRFLLQLSHLTTEESFRTLVEGALVRNMLVVGGVLFREISSLAAFRDVVKLMRRSIEIRSFLMSKAVRRGPLFGDFAD